MLVQKKLISDRLNQQHKGSARFHHKSFKPVKEPIVNVIFEMSSTEFRNLAEDYHLKEEQISKLAKLLEYQKRLKAIQKNEGTKGFSAKE